MIEDQRPRPDLHGFPIVLLFADRKIVVVGGGNIATRKTQGLIAGGAKNITVIAPEISQKLQELEEQGKVKLVWKKFEPTDLDGAFFVTSATDVPGVSRSVFEAGEERNIFVNSADDPVNCSSILMSTVRQGDITIAISTAGRSPAFAAWCRRYLETRVTKEYVTLIDLVNEARESIRSKGVSSELVNWDPVFDFDVVRLVSENKLADVKQIIEETIINCLNDDDRKLLEVNKK